MIAIGGGGDGQLGGAATLCLDLAGQRGDGIGTAKRLERPQPETRRFILVDNLPDAKMIGDLRQIMKRCRYIAGPAADHRLRGIHRCHVERARQVGEGGGGASGVGVKRERGGQRGGKIGIHMGCSFYMWALYMWAFSVWALSPADFFCMARLRYQ